MDAHTTLDPDGGFCPVTAEEIAAAMIEELNRSAGDFRRMTAAEENECARLEQAAMKEAHASDVWTVVRDGQVIARGTRRQLARHPLVNHCTRRVLRLELAQISRYRCAALAAALRLQMLARAVSGIVRQVLGFLVTARQTAPPSDPDRLAATLPRHLPPNDPPFPTFTAPFVAFRARRCAAPAVGGFREDASI
jgi:hypothetical protein